jgi:hypothetical protein
MPPFTLYPSTIHRILFLGSCAVTIERQNIWYLRTQDMAITRPLDLWFPCIRIARHIESALRWQNNSLTMLCQLQMIRYRWDRFCPCDNRHIFAVNRVIGGFAVLFGVWVLWDCLCGVMVRVPDCWPRGPGFDSRRYQILCVAVGLERGPLNLVRINEELLDKK